jgi:hypothetical protein
MNLRMENGWIGLVSFFVAYYWCIGVLALKQTKEQKNKEQKRQCHGTVWWET